ncbi:hypothetical protein [Jeotgalibacillus proteolyticus]|uniref:Uncharacterized protein n=1 Tax=Jeotgalibacillus proteolyticus TaxID=2082395 RepID=A0A2S5GD81_9BACL|nr:hypothetical protein [Jeotgalibacillus proteolyticus]PPA70960.1 hypothetical protein C4B60_09255 [Jeotgalibacillus proteolyticus]
MLLIIAVFVAGWVMVKYMYVMHKKYFIPYLIFQLGVTLLLVRVWMIRGIEGSTWGFNGLVMMAVGLISALIIFLYRRILTMNNVHKDE